MGLVELPLSSLSRGEGNLQRTAKAQKDMEIAIPDVAQRILLEHFAPPAVIINEKGDIVYISGRTGKIFGTGCRKNQYEYLCNGAREVKDRTGKRHSQRNCTEKRRNHEVFEGQDQR